MKNLPVIFSNSQVELSDEVTSMKIETNKRTGEKKLCIATKDGINQFGTLAPCGVNEYKKVSIPSFSTKAERNKLILYLYSKGYRQEDIAAMLNISQATVSKVLKNIR